MIYAGAFYRLTDLKEVVNRTIELIRPAKHDFDSIVVRGVSGILVGSPVAICLNMPLVVVRKPSERAHSSGIVNYDNMGKRCLLLDDFRYTGETEREVLKAIKSHSFLATITECFFYHELMRDQNPWTNPLPPESS